MNTDDFDTLKNMGTPSPSEHARIRAVNAALAAFDASATKYQKKSQGIFSPIRLLFTYLETSGEWIMRRRALIGTAAVVMIAAPVIWVAYEAGKVGENKSHHDAKTETIIEKKTREVKKTIAGDTEKKFKDRLVSGPVSGTSNSQFNQPKKPRESSRTSPDRRKDQQSIGNLALGRDTLIAHQEIIVPRDSSVPAGGSSVKRLEQAPLAEFRAREAVITEQGEKSKPLPQVTARATVHIPAKSSVNSGANQPVETYIVSTDQEEDHNRFGRFETNPVKSVKEEPVSTFSIDVDTSSYSLVRRTLSSGAMPSADMVRVEEMINYFSYSYPGPESAEVPFKSSVAVYETPWNKNTRLLHIGIRGHNIVREKKPRSNLVFLIDVSGSMNSPDKLPLLKSAFRLLVNKLDAEDTVAIVTYAGRAGTVLKPTAITEKAKILAALEQLESGGSTAGAEGIQQAYALARANYDGNGVNRVILATDGDFNVGMSGDDELKQYIEKQRKSGIFLSVLGFGLGNLNDSLMQVLAQNGNGAAAYIDTLKEAHKVLVEEAGSTLFPIARDVKIQIEFNPAAVSEYRLIGYETRALKREDFNNDKVDAGDIGSGHTVTAIYEITPVGSPSKQIDDLRYSSDKKTEQSSSDKASKAEEYAFLKLRYKLPKEDASKLITVPVTRESEKATGTLSPDIRFATAVAAFGQKLRGVSNLDEFEYDAIHDLASGARGEDTYGYRSEFLGLVRLAKSLQRQEQ